MSIQIDMNINENEIHLSTATPPRPPHGPILCMYYTCGCGLICVYIIHFTKSDSPITTSELQRIPIGSLVIGKRTKFWALTNHGYPPKMLYKRTPKIDTNWIEIEIKIKYLGCTEPMHLIWFERRRKENKRKKKNQWENQRW